MENTHLESNMASNVRTSDVSVSHISEKHRVDELMLGSTELSKSSASSHGAEFSSSHILESAAKGSESSALSCGHFLEKKKKAPQILQTRNNKYVSSQSHDKSTTTKKKDPLLFFLFSTVDFFKIASPWV